MVTKYKHMGKVDQAIWETWLPLQVFPQGTTFDYDVHVGEQIKSIEDMPDPYQTNSKFLSQKRIDVVITTPTEIVIIELKDRAGWGAIGQVIGYEILYFNEFRPALPVSTLLLAQSFTLDTRTILDTLQIPYEQVDIGAQAPVGGPPPG